MDLWTQLAVGKIVGKDTCLLASLGSIWEIGCWLHEHWMGTIPQSTSYRVMYWTLSRIGPASTLQRQCLAHFQTENDSSTCQKMLIQNKTNNRQSSLMCLIVIWSWSSPLMTNVYVNIARTIWKMYSRCFHFSLSDRKIPVWRKGFFSHWRI